MDKEAKPISIKVYVVSDALGETADFVVRAASSQFLGTEMDIVRMPYVNNRRYIKEIVAAASEEERCIVAYTLVVDELREEMKQAAAAYRVPTIDILGPVLQTMSEVAQEKPMMRAGLLRRLDEEYFRKVEAVEFAVKYDDGKDPRGLLAADVVLIGVSRTSKTPVCMYLAHKGVKAANVPLVPEIGLPDELFALPPGRVVGLTINPSFLNEIRIERLKTLGLTADADYASLQRILAELEYAETIMKRLGCPVIDVTNRAVEETASKVLEIYYRRERHAK
ncbi:MAG: kinase/pyrophosphorylase [Firmicutes bacterium]|nr:kinase/pyrophosphorylase [Bacillota bacterium]